jgi:hypothetical protein
VSKFVYDLGQFDQTGLQEIGATYPQVVNGEVCKASFFKTADQKQADLLYWGPSFCCIGGEPDKHFGVGANAETGQIGFLAPPFCNRAAFGMLAKGSGTLTLGTAYTIAVNAQVGSYAWTWGSLTENLITVSPSTTGMPTYRSIPYDKGAGLEIVSIVVRYALSSEEIS